MRAVCLAEVERAKAEFVSDPEKGTTFEDIPTGNVSAIVDELLADAAAESAAVSSNDASALVDADSQAINNLSQYNAYDF